MNKFDVAPFEPDLDACAISPDDHLGFLEDAEEQTGNMDVLSAPVAIVFTVALLVTGLF